MQAKGLTAWGPPTPLVQVLPSRSKPCKSPFQSSIWVADSSGVPGILYVWAVQFCKDPVYQWTSKCTKCAGSGYARSFSSRGRKGGKGKSYGDCKCITCCGIGMAPAAAASARNEIHFRGRTGQLVQRNHWVMIQYEARPRA